MTTLPILHNEILDRDHQDILLYLLAMQDGPEDAYRDVEKFQQYLLAHSLREEALMSHLNYPKLLHHLHCHGELLRLAKDFIPSLLVGSNPETLRQKINEMAQLLILHIQIEDGDFAIWKANQEINTPLA